MYNPLILKLESFGRLTTADSGFLEAAAQRTSRFAAREDIVPEDKEPQAVSLILDGWACRYKQLEDGRRQIISLFLPGDMCDPHVFVARTTDQSLGALTPVTVARIRQQAIRAAAAQSTALAEALWWDMQVGAEIQREWIVSLGRRTAVERIAHLFCELSARLQRVDLTNGSEFELPITQADLGDAMGMSTVHVNRSIQDLRATGYIQLKNHRLSIHDERGLRNLAMFDPYYLHLQPQQETQT